jgi:hypothetical protein
MSNRINKSRVNFFDGQRVTERDLDTEQNYFRDAIGGTLSDRGDFGVIDKLEDRDYLLLDLNNISTDNPSYGTVSNGKYDGKIILPDFQPADSSFGERIEVSLSGSNSRGRYSTRVLILGRVFNDLTESGSIEFEILEFRKNEALITKNYYNHIYAIMLNNYSGGECFTEDGTSYSNKTHLSDNSNIIISSAKPLRVYPKTEVFAQKSSPSIDAYLFSHTYADFETFLSQALGVSRSQSEVFRDFSFRKESFLTTDNVGNAIGQKFLSNTDNIQSISVLISKENSGDWSGDLVFSIYDLQTTSSSRVAADPIGFDPSLRPIAQVALDQQDLEYRGIFLDQSPKEIKVDFSRFDCANPSSGIIEKNKYYAIYIERVGDNRVNSLNIFKGDFLPSGKANLGIPLNPEETFSKQNYRMFKYDAATEKYIDYADESLWFSINASCIEVTPGSAYSVDGFYLNIPKYKEYVGETRILNFKDKVSIPNFNTKLYVSLERSEKFLDLDVHPRTGNYIHTRISDSAEISFLSPPADSNSHLILASVNDKNTRQKVSISGSFDSAGLYETDHFYIVNPTTYQKSINYNGMNFIPDTDCQCNNVYQIIDFEIYNLLAGDLDRDGKYTISDSVLISNISGNTINSEVTERRLFGGEFSIEDFYISDLNNDGAIDGFDILKSEDAANGNINFDSGLQIEFIKIYFENIRASGLPSLFSGSATTLSSTNEMTFTANNRSEPLSIRIGDVVNISSPESDTKLYVRAKTVASDEVSVTLYLERESGEAPSFIGSSATIDILSKTNTNIFSDNISLIQTPYSTKNYSIFVDESEFRRFNIDVCDLRSFINYNKRKPYDSSCNCYMQHTCEKPDVVESNITGDLKVAGKLLGESGLPYRGDIDFANIKIPLPAGSIDGCSINIYDSFIKSTTNSCFTSSGLSALKYADGTFVGCEDTESSNDIDKNRIKFIYGIASLFVDTDTTASGTAATSVKNESFLDFFQEEYNSHYPSNYSLFTSIRTSTNVAFAGSSYRSGVVSMTTSSINENINVDVLAGTLTGDFLADFSMSLSDFPSTSSGDSRCYFKISVSNTDGTSGDFSLGFVRDSGELKIFSRTRTFTSMSILIEDRLDLKSFSNPDNKDINFRVRRVSDSIKGYFYIDDDRTQPSVLGLYERVDLNPQKQVGYGNATLDFITESNSADSGLTYSIRVSNINIKNDYGSEETESGLVAYKDGSNLFKRVICTANIPISSQMALVSANLKLKSSRAYTSGFSFNGYFRYIKLANSRNFETLNNYYEPIDSNAFGSISISGPVSEGEVFEIDVKSVIEEMMSKRNFISGITRSFTIEPENNATSNSFEFSSEMVLELTYVDTNQNLTYKVGVDLDTSSGIMTFNTKNILYDESVKENRTVISVGVLLKKSGFVNKDIEIGVESIKSLGAGNCISIEDADASQVLSLCGFIANDFAGGIVGTGYVCGSVLGDASSPPTVSQIGEVSV